MSNNEAKNNWVAVSFGSGKDWAGARARLLKQLDQFDFTSVEILDETWTGRSSLIPSGTQQFIQTKTKGFGYWVWKPYLIKYILQKYPDCVGVFYLDVGCDLNGHRNAMSKFCEYLQIAVNTGSLAFTLSESDLSWTSTLAISELNAEEFAVSNQISATTFFLKNTKENMQFVDEWIYWCTKDNHRLLVEESSNYIDFKNHRHDQSIFSLLWKIKNHNSLPDETYWAPDWENTGIGYPIWASRNRLSVPITASRLLRLVHKLNRRFMLRFQAIVRLLDFDKASLQLIKKDIS